MAGHCLVLQSWVRRPGRSSSNLLVLLLLLLHLLLLLLPGIDFTQPSQLRSHDHSCPFIHTCTSFCSILAVELSSPYYCTCCVSLSSDGVQPSLLCLVVHFTKTNSLIIWRLGLCLWLMKIRLLKSWWYCRWCWRWCWGKHWCSRVLWQLMIAWPQYGNSIFSCLVADVNC